MTIYQPGIPTGTVPLNQDYLNLQGNFTQLNSVYNIDHSALTGTLPPVGTAGYHTAIHLVPQSPPAATAGYGQLFSTQITSVNTDEALFFLTGGNRLLQMTMNFVPSANTNGFTFLPGGLILQWGVKAPPGGSGTVMFSTENMDFPNNLFSVLLTLADTTTRSTQVAIINTAATFDKTQFSYILGNLALKMYWIAIGN